MVLTERKTAKCPDCGGKSLLTSWKPPEGINQRFREFKCDNVACRCVFYMSGTFWRSEHKPSEPNLTP